MQIVLLALLVLPPARGIINPQQQTSNGVFYLQPADELRPRSWQSGVQCLDRISTIYFQRRAHLTRSYNLVFTSAINMSSPAAEIQQGFLKLINEAVSGARSDLYQLRTISDAEPYVRRKMRQNELVFADFYLLVVDSVWRLKQLMNEYVSNMLSWNPGAYFLVLYNNPGRRNAEQQVAHEIFTEMVDMYYVQRVAMLYATNATEYSFLVLNYFMNNACRRVHVRNVGSCHNGVVQAAVGYKSIASALESHFVSRSTENCTFYMCASISAPFVEADCVTGLELRIMNFIRKRLKFNIHRLCLNESRGVFDSEGNWTGLLHRLNNRECDFILGGFYPDNEILAPFWTSDCYFSDSYTWFVKLADPRPAWMALYSIFRVYVWASVILVLFISWFFWYLFVNLLPEPVSHGDLSLTAINALAVSICVSVNERPLCISSRIFFFALALYGLNVVSTYTSNLIAVFTNPGYLHQIDTIEEVLQAGIPFGGLEESRDWFENDDDMWIYKLYNDTPLFEPHSENLQAIRLGERVILSSRMFVLQHNISDHIYAFSHNAFTSPVQMIMKPGFPLIDDFNWLIRYMRDVGILRKIAADFRYNNTYLKRIAKMRPEFKDPAVVLTTEHLEGPFAILIIGCFCGTFAFLAEFFTYWLLSPHLKKHFGWKLVKGNHPTESEPDKRAQKVKRHQKVKQLRALKDNQKLPTKAVRELRKAAEEDTQSYRVNMTRNIRFTPLKRRHFDIE